MKVLVIGDSCKDVHIYGSCDRICPDAPVPIFVPIRQTTNRGMAGNVYENLISLDVKCDLITNEEEITKTRFVEEKTNYIIVRVDSGEEKIDRVSNLKNIDYEQYDVIVISDYDKGFLTREDIQYILKAHPTTFMDTKKILGPWALDALFVKINELERKKSKHYLDNNLFYEKLITTVGSRGCEYKNDVYSVEKAEIKDLSGAGDSFLAALVYQYLHTKSIGEAISFANACATKVVQQKGVTLINDI